MANLPRSSKAKTRAKINPEILKWAREALSLSREEVVRSFKNVSIDAESLEMWETGRDFPSVPIAKKLAKFYGIHFIVLFLPSLPQRIKPLKDFRGVSSQSFSKNFIFLMREIQGKQELLKDILFEKKARPLEYVGSVKLSEGVPGLVRALRRIISSRYKMKKKAEQNLNPLADLLENMGISISFANSINGHHLWAVSPTEVRGFAISDPIAPFIFINSKDSKNAQLFTLIHELCHILLGETGVGDISSKSTNKIEVLCNQATAEFLIPTKEFRQALEATSAAPLEEVLSSMSRSFPVSVFSILIKLVTLGKISRKTFEREYLAQQINFEQNLQQKNLQEKNHSSNHIVRHDVRILRINGKRFTRFVLDGLASRKIGFADACAALGVANRNNFEKYLNRWSKKL